MWLIILLTALLAICLHLLVISPYKYWKKRGVPNPKPFPLVGNVGPSLILTKQLGDIVQDIYKYVFINTHAFYYLSKLHFVIFLTNPYNNLFHK